MEDYLIIGTNIPWDLQQEHFGVVNVFSGVACDANFKRNKDNKLFIYKPFMENLGKEAYIFTVDYLVSADKYLLRKFHYNNLTVNDVQAVYAEHVTYLCGASNMKVEHLASVEEMVNAATKTKLHATDICIPSKPEDFMETDIQISIHVLFAE